MKHTPEKQKSQVTDIAEFFSDTIDRYEHFECSVLRVIDRIPSASPGEISQECDRIVELRNSLALLDQQILDIMELAGREISQPPLFQDYRLALAGANMACHNLSQELKALKMALIGASS